MFKLSYLHKLLMVSHFMLFEGEETPAVEIKVETPAENTTTEAVTAQAAEMVDTAKELAKEIAATDADLSNIWLGIQALQLAISELRAENADAHRSIMGRLGVVEDMLQDVEDDAEDAADAAETAAAIVATNPPAETPVEEVSQAAAQVAEAAVEVAEAPQERSKKQRRWL